MSKDLERWHGTPCLNCGHILDGDYCSACGQRATDIDRPLLTLFTDFAEGFFSFEHSVWHTLRTLLFKPGRLTREYLAGRRIRYMSPIRLYLVSSLIFFGIVGLTGAGVEIEGDPVNEDGEAALETQEENGASIDSTLTGAPGDDAAPRDSVSEDIGERMNRDPDAFKARFMEWSPRFMFLLVPLSALVMKLMFIRHQRPLLHFLVFVLHIHALFFLVMAVAVPLGELDHEAAEVPAALLFLGILVNVFVAQRRVFGGGWFKTLVKMFLVWNIYAVLLGLVVIGTFALAIHLT